MELGLSCPLDSHQTSLDKIWCKSEKLLELANKIL